MIAEIHIQNNLEDKPPPAPFMIEVSHPPHKGDRITLRLFLLEEAEQARLHQFRKQYFEQVKQEKDIHKYTDDLLIIGVHHKNNISSYGHFVTLEVVFKF